MLRLRIGNFLAKKQCIKRRFGFVSRSRASVGKRREVVSCLLRVHAKDDTVDTVGEFGHSRAGGNPEGEHWTPVFTGVTR